MRAILFACVFLFALAIAKDSPVNNCLTPQCGGFCGFVSYNGLPTNCSFVQINLESSAAHVLAELNCCKDHRSSEAASPFTAFDNSHKNLLYVSGNGDYVWGVNVQTGVETQIAQLPATTDTVIALNTLLADDYSSFNLFFSTATTLYQLLDVPLSTTSRAAALPTFTPVLDLGALQFSTPAPYVCGFNNTLYYLDSPAGELFVVSVASTPASLVRSIYPTCDGIKTAVSVQYWIGGQKLLTFIGTTLYTIDPKTGACASFMKLPAEAVAPVQSTTIFSDMFFVSDANTMFEINLRAKSVEGYVNLKNDGNIVGPIQYYY